MSIADTPQGRVGVIVYAVLLALANIAVIVAYAVNRRLQTLANRFVISLAISDLLVSIFLIPLETWLPNHDSTDALKAFFLFASLLNVCGCTYDRYIAIKNPLHYPAVMTKKRFFQVMVVVWTIPLIIALIPQTWIQNSDALGLFPSELNNYKQKFVAFMIVLVLLVCVVLIAIYVYIFTVAKRHYEAMKKSEPSATQCESDDRKARKMKRQSVRNFFLAIKSTMLFATIGANFILCWLPLIVINVAYAFDLLHLLSIEFFDVAKLLMYLNSFLNPVVYAFFQKEFRRTILRPCMKTRTISPADTTGNYRTDYETNQNSK